MSDSDLRDLQHHSLSGLAEIVAGKGGLPMIRIASPAASAEIYLHGAQVTSWRPSGADEVLFLSRLSRWEEGRAIRGGIPICFPWFRAKADNALAPAHGVVRTRAWRLESLREEAGGVAVTLSVESDGTSRRWYPRDFRIEHRIKVGERLELSLAVSNTGADPMLFEQALHTYHLVGDVRQVRVDGLDGADFLDNTAGNFKQRQQGPVTYRKQTDNAYLSTAAALDLIDTSMGRCIRTTKEHSQTTVVWNPWQDGAATLADLGDEEWQTMACVEASNILESAIVLAPGASHTMKATLSLAALLTSC